MAAHIWTQVSQAIYSQSTHAFVSGLPNGQTFALWECSSCGLYARQIYFNGQKVSEEFLALSNAKIVKYASTPIVHGWHNPTPYTNCL